MSSRPRKVEEKLRGFKRHYFLQALLRGGLYWGSLGTALLLFMIVLESQLWLSSLGRGVLYFSFWVLVLGTGAYWVGWRLWRLCRAERLLSDEAVARDIGNHLPKVRDKLLNYVQLRPYAAYSRLAQAGLEQRARHFRYTPFTRALPWQKSMYYARYFLSLCGVFLLLWWWDPKFITQSTERIYYYERSYAMPAPFQFFLENRSLDAFAGEPFDLEVKLRGKYIPEKVYIVAAGRYIGMQKGAGGRFFHRFEQLYKDLHFHMEAEGHKSIPYLIRSRQRPFLSQARLHLHPPPYTRLPKEQLLQLKNIEVPEGTRLEWLLQAQATEQISLYFEKSKPLAMQAEKGQFRASRRFLKSSSYIIGLQNSYSSNKDTLRYFVDVRKDEAPQLYPQVFADTLLYRVVVLAGYATDDYGLSAIRLQYRLEQGEHIKEHRLAVPFVRQSRSRGTFYLEWQLDSLGLKNEDRLSYRLQAWDNDGIRGAKATLSPWYYLEMPSEAQMQSQIAAESQYNRKNAAKTYTQSKNLQSEIKKMQDRLKIKKNLDWQDKKHVKDLIKQREKITQAIETLKEKHNFFEEKHQRFDSLSQDMQEKMTQLRNLLEKVLDPETKKLYEELQRLIQENAYLPEVQKTLDKLSQKEDLQANNLERALALMKRLQYELQLADIKKQLKALEQKQSALQQKTRPHSDTEALAKEQEQLQKDFQDIEKDIEAAEEMNQALEMPFPDPQLQEEEKNVTQHQAESHQALQENNTPKAKEAQEKAKQALQRMQKELQKTQMQAQAMQIEIDVQLMQKLLDNLITLSLQQETLEADMEGDIVSYIEHDEMAKQQFDIQQAAAFTLDSLKAFALRNFKLSGHIHKEIQTLNLHLKEGMYAMQERETQKARNQQRYIMISFNKLALFISELLDRLEEGQEQTSLGSGEKPSLSKLQEDLLKQIQELKKSGKQGEPLSEELSRMIAQQEAIRRQVEEMSHTQEGMLSEKENLQKLLEKMKEVERKLAYKDLSEELIKTQKEIKTRLLNLESAQKEEDKNQKRKSEQAKSYKHLIPPEMKPYIPDKRKDLMQLKLQPLPLNPYYEEEVRKYLQRLQETQSSAP